jgi:ribose transport system ATP-binding protein
MDSGHTLGEAALAHPALLQMRGISKRFQAVNALQDIDFDLTSGEVHAVCGENGAGKSTLMKILSGELRPDTGEISLRGESTSFTSTREAQRAGIAMIHQELNLVPHLSVAENMFLAREPQRFGFIDRTRINADARRWLERLGLAIEPKALVRSLSVAQRQMVEIAKALSLDAAILIMDEPTSSLTESETSTLFGVVRDLRRAGVAIVYISHRLNELPEIADRVTVLRDGRRVSTGNFADTRIDDIVVRMVGRPLDDKYPQPTRVPNGAVLMHVAGLTRSGVFRDIEFDLRRGEILGFAGLVGAGRTEVARAIFGADRFDAGSIHVHGKALKARSPRDAIRRGVAYLSEDRKAHGLAIDMTVAHNVSMANLAALSDRFGFIRLRDEEHAARRYIDLLGIRTPSARQLARLLSGGNQQKVVVAKWLFRDSRILFFDEPTRGIDVGAKYAIYRLLDELAARGIGVVLISSDLPEILGMTDRVAVFRGGRITGVLETRRTSQEEIMRFASGASELAGAREGA